MFGATSAAVLAVAVLGVGAALAGNGDDCPPNPVPGHCYEKVLIPPQYQDVSEQVVEPGQPRSRIVPAVYGEAVRQELVCAERVEMITIPATYRTVYETVVVRPGGWRTETIPAQYETVTERVLARAAYTEWRRGALADYPSTYPGPTRVLPTGEVLCLVEVPAEYRLVTRQVLRVPARTVQIEVPPETRVVPRQVVDCPEHVERRVIPAEYRYVRTRVLVTPERVETWTLPPVYRTITSRRLISPGRYEWRELQCENGGPATYRAPAYSAAPSGTSYGYSPAPPGY